MKYLKKYKLFESSKTPINRDEVIDILRSDLGEDMNYSDFIETEFASKIDGHPSTIYYTFSDIQTINLNPKFSRKDRNTECIALIYGYEMNFNIQVQREYIKDVFSKINKTRLKAYDIECDLFRVQSGKYTIVFYKIPKNLN